ncbi:peptidase T, partial [Enterobacteriaceae bacterium ML5]
MSTTIAKQLTERFYRYLSVTSQSDASVNTLPSTPGQHDMARLLA